MRDTFASLGLVFFFFFLANTLLLLTLSRKERERETRVDIETKIGKKDALMAWVRKRDNDIRCR